MQANLNFSSLQASYTTTQWSAAKEELANGKANSVPQSTINQDARGSASSIAASNSLLGEGLGDFQKTILNKALGKISEIQDEMMKLWEELFPSAGSGSNSSQGAAMTLEDFLYNKNFATQIAGSGINITQGFFQSLSVSISGSIVGSDGVSKNLDININISQSFMQNLQFNRSNATQNIPQGVNKKVVDPLVIDYEGSGTELSDTKMRFDLDSDGTPDQISTLKKGSGFLALDKNNDGKINDGNELFGTKSGDGFKDLSVYDSNKDGKIDKEDPIYDKLRIWTPNEKGEGQLVGLGEKGIGVIYLNAQESKEMMKGQNGDLLGIKQKTADYLREDGSSGQIHHIDLVSEKIKDGALENQAKNDAILSQILGNKTYQGMGASLSNLQVSITQSSMSGIFGNSTGLFDRVSVGNIASFELNISVSLSSLQSASNGVSAQTSQIWAKMEESFARIETAKESFSNLFDKQKEQNNLVDSLLKRFDEESFKELNRLLFKPFDYRAEAFKNYFDSQAVKKLLTA